MSSEPLGSVSRRVLNQQEQQTLGSEFGAKLVSRGVVTKESINRISKSESKEELANNIKNLSASEGDQAFLHDISRIVSSGVLGEDGIRAFKNTIVMERLKSVSELSIGRGEKRARTDSQSLDSSEEDCDMNGIEENLEPLQKRARTESQSIDPSEEDCDIEMEDLSKKKNVNCFETTLFRNIGSEENVFTLDDSIDSTRLLNFNGKVVQEQGSFKSIYISNEQLQSINTLSKKSALPTVTGTSGSYEITDRPESFLTETENLLRESGKTKLNEAWSQKEKQIRDLHSTNPQECTNYLNDDLIKHGIKIEATDNLDTKIGKLKEKFTNMALRHEVSWNLISIEINSDIQGKTSSQVAIYLKAKLEPFGINLEVPSGDDKIKKGLQKYAAIRNNDLNNLWPGTSQINSTIGSSEGYSTRTIKNNQIFDHSLRAYNIGIAKSSSPELSGLTKRDFNLNFAGDYSHYGTPKHTQQVLSEVERIMARLPK